MVEDVGFNKKAIMCTCFLFFFLDIIINLDHGAMPSAATSIKKDLKLENATFGTLGSMVFVGLVSGSLCFAYVSSRASYKTILITSFVLNAIGIFGIIAT